MHGEITNCLFIGYRWWPSALDHVAWPDSITPVKAAFVQTGGINCTHERLFGITFALPSDDPLLGLGLEYETSHIPGYGETEYGPSLDDVLVAQAKLVALGARIDDFHYPRLSEGHLPIAAESAWAYAANKKLMLQVVSDSGSREARTEEYGLTALAECKQMIDHAWVKVQQAKYLEEYAHHPPERIYGAVVTENSD